MQTLSDWPLTQLVELQNELSQFMNSQLYQVYQMVSEGDKVMVEESIISHTITDIGSILEREALIGAARDRSNSTDFFERLQSEVANEISLKRKS